MKLLLSVAVVGTLAAGTIPLAARGQQGAPSEGRPQAGPRLKIERDLEVQPRGRAGAHPRSRPDRTR